MLKQQKNHLIATEAVLGAAGEFVQLDARIVVVDTVVEDAKGDVLVVAREPVPTLVVDQGGNIMFYFVAM